MRVFSRAGSIAAQTVIWAATWGLIGAVLSFVISLIDPEVIGPGEGPADVSRIVGTVGAGAGTLFGLLLAIVERRTAIAEIPMLRAIAWGIVAGMAMRLLQVTDAVFSNLVVLGAVAAVVSVVLARTARRGARLESLRAD